MALAKAKEIVSSLRLVVIGVFSCFWQKTYRGFCTSVKKLFTQMRKQLSRSSNWTKRVSDGDGDDIQAALLEWTVPNVFIGGKHVGGCDSKPVNMLTGGAIGNNSPP
ncbi:hypothetical protein MKW92_026137 [Papaver armeniacum]|nr:hypothetical protein MKW92_026137 [Papaver armeniacum]